jgi:hypothetical protein
MYVHNTASTSAGNERWIFLLTFVIIPPLLFVRSFNFKRSASLSSSSGSNELSILGTAVASSASSHPAAHGLAEARMQTLNQLKSAVIDASALIRSTKEDQQDRKLQSGSTTKKQAARHLRPKMEEEDTAVAQQEGSCEEKLAQCEAEASERSYLFVQMANHGTLSWDSTSYCYMLSTANLHNKTWVFTDRPFEQVDTINTTNFFDDFDQEAVRKEPLPLCMRTIRNSPVPWFWSWWRHRT